MRRVVLSLAVGAAVVVPASSASAMQEIPPINCGIVSCTEQVERKVEFVVEQTGGVQECVANTVNAIENVLQGTPQPTTCDL